MFAQQQVNPGRNQSCEEEHSSFAPILQPMNTKEFQVAQAHPELFKADGRLETGILYWPYAPTIHVRALSLP